MLGENRLIARAIGWGVGASDVGRERHVADFFENFEQAALGVEADDAFTEVASAEDFGVQVFGDDDALAGAHFLAGTDQGVPGVGGDLLGEEDFDASGTVFAASVEAGWKDAGVVEDQAIGGAGEGWEVAEEAVFEGGARTVEDQHAGGVASGQGLLRDKVFGKIVIEVGE